MISDQRSAMLAPIVVSPIRQLGLRLSLPRSRNWDWKSVPVSGIVQRSR